MYAEGKGVERNEAKAAALFQQACDGGEASAGRNLGILYERGKSVPKDEAKAVALYKQACDVRHDLHVEV